MNLIKRLWTEESGQGMTEYALIIGGIALAAIMAIGLFGTAISEWFDNLRTQLP
jgi:pilus assembly protein Flp/PilA